MPREALILDLDGTILSVNSFRLWSLYLLRGTFPKLDHLRRALVTVAAMQALTARKIGRISHETLKWRMQRIWRWATAGDGGAAERVFVSGLRRHVRPELTPLLAAIADGKVDAVMATAAVSDYAVSFGHSIGFSNILATPRLREAGEPSNVGVRKRDAVLDFIIEKGWQNRPLVLFTDHRDDLPLIRICPTVFWFGSEEERQQLDQMLPQTSLRSGFPGDDQLQLAC